MRDLCVIGLLLIAMPWIVGIMICILKFLGEKYDKLIRWFELFKDEKEKKQCLEEYRAWYTPEEKAMMYACMLNDRHERGQIFNIDDLKIWKAFI